MLKYPDNPWSAGSSGRWSIAAVIFLAGEVWAISGGYTGALTLGLGALVAVSWLTVVALDKRAGLR
ncbi:hypothetical protein Aple_057740 [Acrocarpospora pleiomorpha]|uniref:Uncharacterized protein n=1 Tax=Acrocarpospora pleiomorpha TaxID=90975 RepID=A0A5M3XNG8_9ACTN|nr:hypothetical protein [Acrocarpospora pleiomorpha]GES22875.1 hypothetical protein Aple_057740 [Acrocarpospora pleiomorpha]